MDTVLTIRDVTYERLATAIDHSLLRRELTVGEVHAGCELAGTCQRSQNASARSSLRE